MTYLHKTFVWRELLTQNVELAKSFYQQLFGWEFRTSAMPTGDYHIAILNGAEVAGLMRPPEVMPSFWSSYVSVNSVDTATAFATAHGGQLCFGPIDIPGVGRLATIMDPQGGVISVFKSEKGDLTPDQPKIGHFCWETLNTSDTTAAALFYSKVIGWEVRPFRGAEGIHVFATGPDDTWGVASMNPTPPNVPTHWSMYLLVGNLAEANNQARSLGATIIVEQINIPTIGDFSIVQDPTGAMICFFKDNVMM